MSFTLNKILSGDTVGEAFINTNLNTDKQIVSANTSGSNLRFVSLDGTVESVDLNNLVLGDYLSIPSGGTVQGKTTFIVTSAATSFVNSNTASLIDITGGQVEFFHGGGLGGSTKLIHYKTGQTNTVYLPIQNGTLALLSDLTGATSSGNFVPLTGTTSGSPMQGNLVFSGTNGIIVQNDSTNLRNSLTSSGLTLGIYPTPANPSVPEWNMNISPSFNYSSTSLNIYDTATGTGSIVSVPDISGNENKLIKVHSDGLGFDYYDLTGKFVPLTGTSFGSEITGEIVITDSNFLKVEDGSAISSVQVNTNNIEFKDDYNEVKTTLQKEALNTTDATIKMLDTLADGYMVIVPTPVGEANKSIRVNASGNGWEYFESTGGTSITGTYVSGLTSAGTGNILLLSSITNNKLVQKSLIAGANIGITESNGTITISGSASGGGSGTVTGATSAGGGIDIYQSATTSNLTFRSISGTNGFETTTSGSLVFIRPLNRTINTVYMTNASGNMINSDFLLTDNNNKTLGIGVGAATSSRLTLAGSAAAMSGLRFTTSATDISSPVNGDTWYLTTGNSLKFRKNTQTTDFIFKDNNTTFSGSSANNRIVEANSTGTLFSTREIVTFGVFNATSSVTITNTTTETSCISSSLVGSRTLLASTGTSAQLVLGKKFRFTANGTIATHSSAGDLTARLKLGSLVIASISGFNLHNNISAPNNFYIESSFTIRTQGASGTVIGGGFLQTDHEHLISNAQTIVGLNNLGSVTLDTTSDKVFDFTFQFGTASANNVITINEATLEYLN
jgi:hypothetical protein